MLGSAPGGRGESLGRFLGAAFAGFGLLLLLVGVQQGLAPALAGGGGCIFAGLALLAVVRRERAPLAILDGERGEAVLCRRRLGKRAFRLFPLASLEVTGAPDGRSVRLHPSANGEAGRDIPGLPSRLSDREWRQGMALPTGADEAPEAATELVRWLRLTLEGASPQLAESCDPEEFAALLGKAPPAALFGDFLGASEPVFPSAPDAESLNGPRGRKLRPTPAPHPEIRRAPDLRDASGNRDKRE